MNRKQLLILWLGVAALVAAGLYPPYRLCFYQGLVQSCEPVRWHLLWEPTGTEKREWSYDRPPWREDIEFSILAIEWAVIAVVTLAAMLTCRR